MHFLPCLLGADVGIVLVLIDMLILIFCVIEVGAGGVALGLVEGAGSEIVPVNQEKNCSVLFSNEWKVNNL